MAYLNRVQLIGNLGADPESRTFPSGDEVVNLRLATTKRWKDKKGEAQSRTDWHRVVITGAVARVAAEYLHKGSSIYVEGELRERKYQDKDGADRYIVEIVSREFQLLDRKAPEVPEAGEDE